jgi:GDP/UDP-N,N'-diacetylbacillosamine 2-epimerase (hydrolysing)
MKKKIIIHFFTGKRGGFSHFIPILRLLDENKRFDYKILAGDMHLSNFFGKTINEIKNYSSKIIRLKKNILKDTISNRLSVVSNTINSLSKIFSRLKPDFLFVLGDRAEVLGASIVGAHFNIPLIHMYGGDITQGGTDEPSRHAITKLSNLHLTSNNESYKNVKKMGEENWRVFNTGLTSLDLLKKKFFKSKNYLEKKYNINLNKPLIILIQHPVTWQIKDSKKQILETMKSIKSLKIQTIAIYPCSDPGFKNIVEIYQRFKNEKYFHCYKNIEINDFYSLLKFSKMLIGNSSCGMTECGYLMKPVINIGIRQEGRICGKNVIHVDHNNQEITNTIKKILKSKNSKQKNYIYGNGSSAPKIIKIILKNYQKKNIIKKKFIAN